MIHNAYKNKHYKKIFHVMNKKCKLVTMLKNGSIVKEAILFQDLERAKEGAFFNGNRDLLKRIDEIDTVGRKYGDSDYGFSQKDELIGSWHLEKERIEDKVNEQKRLYSKVCSISLHQGYLYLFISKLLPYSLSIEEKQELIGKESPSAEIIEIAGKKHLFYEVRTVIPQEFQDKDPEKDTEFATWILNNLRCNALTAIIIANEWKSSGEFELVK